VETTRELDDNRTRNVIDIALGVGSETRPPAEAALLQISLSAHRLCANAHNIVAREHFKANLNLSLLGEALAVKEVTDKTPGLARRLLLVLPVMGPGAATDRSLGRARPESSVGVSQCEGEH
jgi:hypothetical protein